MQLCNFTHTRTRTLYRNNIHSAYFSGYYYCYYHHCDPRWFSITRFDRGSIDLETKKKKNIYIKIYIYINICLRISDILIDSSSKNWSGRVEREKEREWIGDLSKHVDIVINWIRSKESVFLRKRRKRKKMRESKRVSMSCTLNAPPLEASCLCSMWSS